MISWKICLVGSFAVGKTSLVRQFVSSIFSDQYLSTVGVKISKKIINMDGKELCLMIWDMEGKDSFTAINTSYLKGLSGFFVVVDCTRRETLEEALTLKDFVIGNSSDVPYIILLNKSDMVDHNELVESDFNKLTETGVRFIKTSAKTGKGVEESFLELSRMIEKSIG